MRLLIVDDTALYRKLLSDAASQLTGGRLFLGGSESLLSHQDLFASEMIGESVFYRRKP